MLEYLPNSRTWLSYLERCFWSIEREYYKASYRGDYKLLDALFGVMCRYSRMHIAVDNLPVIPLCGFSPSLDMRLKDVYLL